MTKTLILLFHRNLAESSANAALANAAATLPDTEIVNMQDMYPDGRIDVMRDGAVEARRLLSTDRVIWQFPLQWYSTPPLLKAWQDAVLTRMFYIYYETEGRHLEGTPLMIAATAGNVPESYAPNGVNRFTMDAMLTPLRATAIRCGMPWGKPFVVYQADWLGENALEAAGSNYIRAIRRWRDETSVRTKLKRTA